MKKNKLPLQSWLIAAILPSLLWLIGGIAIFAYPERGGNAVSQVKTFITFWFLGLMSLFFLTKMVASLLLLVSDSSTPKMDVILDLTLWTVLKIGVLGLMIWKMVGAQEDVGIALALGVGTLFVIPLSSAFIQRWIAKSK